MKSYRYLRTLLASLSILAIVGCARPVHPYYPPDPGKSSNKTVYVVNAYGWHTNIVLSRQDAEPYLHPFGDFNDARYIEIGWGDETFYQAKKTTFRMGIEALFWPTGSVLHVVLLESTPEGLFPDAEVVAVELSHEGFKRLAAFINDSFAVDGKGQIISLGSGLYGRSRFYRAEGTFWLFNNCNSWSAEALRASGFPIITFGVVTSAHVMEQLKEGKTYGP